MDCVSNPPVYKLTDRGSTSKSISGKKAEKKLEECYITTNKNMIPYDQRSPLITSGLRLGTPALTTRGMTEKEMRYIAELIHKVLSKIDNEDIVKSTQLDVLELCKRFPLYSEMSYEMP